MKYDDSEEVAVKDHRRARRMVRDGSIQGLFLEPFDKARMGSVIK